jgi:ribosome recycling factor
MQKEAKKIITERMEKTISSLTKDLAGIRTGRASLSIFDGIMVDYFGTPTPINHVATLGIPESRLITIQPWDPKTISEIEKAIKKSDLGLNPGNDGKIIRVTIPQLTEEEIDRRNTEDYRFIYSESRRNRFSQRGRSNGSIMLNILYRIMNIED